MSLCGKVSIHLLYGVFPSFCWLINFWPEYNAIVPPLWSYGSLMSIRKVWFGVGGHFCSRYLQVPWWTDLNRMVMGVHSIHPLFSHLHTCAIRIWWWTLSKLKERKHHVSWIQTQSYLTWCSRAWPCEICQPRILEQCLWYWHDHKSRLYLLP